MAYDDIEPLFAPERSAVLEVQEDRPRHRALDVNWGDYPKDSARDFDLDEMDSFFTLKAEGYGEMEIGLSLGWSPAMTKRFISNPERAEILKALEERQHESMERAVHRTGMAGNVQAQKLWLFSKAAHRGWSDVRNVNVDVRSQQEVVVSVREGVMGALRQGVRESGPEAIAALQAMYADDDDVIDAEILEG